MERLTRVEEDGTILCIGCAEEEECNGDCLSCQHDIDAIQKLAEYEDAEEQGLLLRLPTNRVWFICDAKTKYATIMPKTIDDLCIYDIKELLKGNSKRYFMTKEEAEQALSKLEAKV